MATGSPRTKRPPEPDKSQYCSGCGYDRPVAAVTVSGYLCTTCAPDTIELLKQAIGQRP